jgi:predicted transcriptional regulator
MKRNLMSELKEGIEVLSEKRNMTMGELVKDYADIIDKQREEIKNWEKCAEDLVDYAHEFVHQLSLWGKGYDRNDRQIKQAEDAIEEYLKLKNKNTQ